MSKRDAINSQSFARESGFMQGDLPLANLLRLHDKLVDTAGTIAYQLVGQMSERNKPQLSLTIEGSVLLCCQRCLGTLTYPVQIKTVLELINKEEDLSQEEFEDDAKDFLVATEELDVAKLVEDELILSLPFVPRHENCALPLDGQATGKESEVNLGLGTDAHASSNSPFAILKMGKGKMN